MVQPKELRIPTERRAGPNKLTIGSAFFHSLSRATSDFVLFLEKAKGERFARRVLWSLGARRSCRLLLLSRPDTAAVS